MRMLLAVLAALLVLAAPAAARTPAYKVGAATRDITPVGPTNLGGFGLGDGTIPDNPAFSRGGVPKAYLQRIHDQTVAAIEAAYRDRRPADLVAGHSDASDLIYNQSCTEALNQSKEPDYPGPEACATPGKDGMFRVVQATATN